MRIKAFELTESLPKLEKPKAIVVIQLWIDVNNMGSMILEELRNRFEATQSLHYKRKDKDFWGSSTKGPLYLNYGSKNA